MEEHYHNADPFRWHLNAFLKALREVPQLVQMALQNEPGFTGWFTIEREELNRDPIIHSLAEKRNSVVHKNRLLPKSEGRVGVAEGYRMRRVVGAPIDPLMDSEEALIRCALLLRDCDFLGLLTPDDDSQPCVEREWRLSEFDSELVDLCARAWLRVGQMICAVLRWQGAEPPALSLECRHSGRNFRMKLYDRAELIKKVEAH